MALYFQFFCLRREEEIVVQEIWNKLTEELVSSWNVPKLIPALVFWVCSVAVWLTTHDSGSKRLIFLQSLLNSLPVHTLLLVAVVGLVFLSVSSGIVEWITPTVIRLLEGYWWHGLDFLCDILTEGKKKKCNRKKKKWLDLNQVYNENKNSLSEFQIKERALLAQELAIFYPTREVSFMPTRLGNILGAAEEYSYVRYGLEITVVWPRLWLILPEYVQKEIVNARRRLDTRIQMCIWYLLFSIWAIICTWSKFPLSTKILSITIACFLFFCIRKGILDAAISFGELLRAAFDTYRFKLYEALHWHQPISPEEEPHYGEEITIYLRRNATLFATTRFPHFVAPLEELQAEDESDRKYLDIHTLIDISEPHQRLPLRSSHQKPKVVNQSVPKSRNDRTPNLLTKLRNLLSRK